MDGPWLGLDYGRKRIGVAVATALGTVHPRPRLDRTTTPADLAALRALVEETQAAGVVVGLPHNMDGSESAMEREVRAFAVSLAAACGVPVYGADERLTSEAADSALKGRFTDWRDRKRRLDSAAACILLQDFVDTPPEARAPPIARPA